MSVVAGNPRPGRANLPERAQAAGRQQNGLVDRHYAAAERDGEAGVIPTRLRPAAGAGTEEVRQAARADA